MKVLSFEERQEVALEVLIEFDRFCQAHNINYILGAGTLLGAVRHKGFIPWDDDIDVYMMRDQYDKFCSVYASETESYILLTYRTDPEYSYAYARLCDVRTVGVPRHNISCANLGVFIDILPLDGVPRSQLRRRIQYEKAAFLTMLCASFFAWETPSFSKAQSSRQKLKAILAPFVKLPGRLFWLKRLDACARKYALDTSDFVCDYVAVPSSLALLKGETFKRSWFDELCFLEFGSHVFPAPNNHHEMLQGQYGDTYMTPIKTEDAENGHDCIMYWR